MAFLRFTRDKRGYEHFYLVQPITNRRGKVRTRVLYWFRTPPNVKVGRQPFDEPLRRAIEAQNPDITFDWQKIIDTPIPSADAEKWRERRRVERAQRAARQTESARETEAEDGEEQEEVEEQESGIDEPPTMLAAAAEVSPAAESATGGFDARPAPPDDRQRRRRRRRGRRGRPERPPVSCTPARARS